jgi:branched-chain amino acid transport system substrate-binding protein
VLCILLAVVAGSCGGQATHVVARGPDIRVGAALSLTGSLAQEGRLTRQGYELWLGWVNGRGGIVAGHVRRLVRLTVVDDQSRADVAGLVAQRLIDQDHVQFLLGPYGSDTTAAVAAVADGRRMPLVEGGGAAPDIFSHGYRYVFGVLSPTDRYMTGVINLAATLRPRPQTMAVLSADDSFSQAVAQSVVAYAPARGFEIVSNQRYPAGSTDLTGVVARAKAARPDLVINTGHLAEALAIQQAAKHQELDAKMFAYSVGPSTPDFVSELGPDADFVFDGSQWTPQVRYQPQVYLTVAEYVAAYRATFHTLDAPSYGVAESTAAALALELGIEHAGDTRPDRVRDALATLDVMTFYGRLKFDPRGVNVYKPMVVEQIQQGRHHTVYPPDIADARPIYPAPSWADR